MADAKLFVGVFSYQSVRRGYPTVYYRDVNGKTVEVCAVYNSVEEAKSSYKWEDMQVVSTTLVEYVSKGRSGEGFWER